MAHATLAMLTFAINVARGLSLLEVAKRWEKQKLIAEVITP